MICICGRARPDGWGDTWTWAGESGPRFWVCNRVHLLAYAILRARGQR